MPEKAESKPPAKRKQREQKPLEAYSAQERDKIAMWCQIIKDWMDTRASYLEGEQRELAETVGITAYRKLVQVYAGQFVYISKAETVLLKKRNQRIRAEYTGQNVRELAIKYNLSESTIRVLTSTEKKRIDNEPTEGQMPLV